MWLLFTSHFLVIFGNKPFTMSKRVLISSMSSAISFHGVSSLIFVSKHFHIFTPYSTTPTMLRTSSSIPRGRAIRDLINRTSLKQLFWFSWVWSHAALTNTHPSVADVSGDISAYIMSTFMITPIPGLRIVTFKSVMHSSALDKMNGCCVQWNGSKKRRLDSVPGQVKKIVCPTICTSTFAVRGPSSCTSMIHSTGLMIVWNNGCLFL